MRDDYKVDNKLSKSQYVGKAIFLTCLKDILACKVRKYRESICTYITRSYSTMSVGFNDNKSVQSVLYVWYTLQTIG